MAKVTSPDFTLGSEGSNLKSVAVRLTVPPAPVAAAPPVVEAWVAALLVLLSSLPPPQPATGTATAGPITKSAATRRFVRTPPSAAFVGIKQAAACSSSYAPGASRD